ncbi:Phosphoglucosamine mutase [Thalassoglobus neptunius]|uniref:Phosphoglucosamine mutase n=1 Tax=Thalassoglobus neptunius TaxID=1938619 RepID=A0A5C5X2F5_9PLAN|nr:hypothetical protein [Thalassoglobus neptunius]TWT57010.1 Phosphoglucosamine mutase [Thalassoglobus neptunius]
MAEAKRNFVEIAAASPGEFCCPGESQPISKSLHLARLAAGYELCAKCIHRVHTGSLPKSVVRRLQQHSPSTEHAGPLVSSNEIRGIYLNNLTRSALADVVEHLLHLVEEDMSNRPKATLKRVLVGHDWRTSSGDLVVGVVEVLRRWGWEIADLGQVSQSCFEFANDKFHASLGLFVTGGVHPEKVNGLEIYDGSGERWSATGRYERLEAALKVPASRTSRQSGHYQTVEMESIYAAQCRSWFADVLPLRIALACGEPRTLKLLRREFQRADCEVDQIASNFSEANFSRQLTQFRYQVRERHVDFGVLIRSDGQSFHLFDERGQELTSGVVRRLLECARSPEILSQILEEFACARSGHSSETQKTDTRLQLHSRSSVRTDDQGKYWIDDACPACDSILVSALIASLLSRFEWPLSILGAAIEEG